MNNLGLIYEGGLGDKIMCWLVVCKNFEYCYVLNE